MPNAFLSLNNSEYQELIDAVPLIAILIGGADGDFDEKEQEWAKKIVHIRSFAHDVDLKPIYQDLDPVFSEKMKSEINSLPSDLIERNKIISERLSRLNLIFPKLKTAIAARLYEGYIEFADQVAKSSGGFMRMLAVTEEESEWIGLPMLDPIFLISEEEE
ncbi:MAG: hypothetical protein ABI851_02435 [Saprospiraceae bacterium]